MYSPWLRDCFLRHRSPFWATKLYVQHLLAISSWLPLMDFIPQTYLSLKPNLYLIFSVFPSPILPVAHDRNADVTVDYYLLDKHLTPCGWILDLVTSPCVHCYSCGLTAIIFCLNYSSSLPAGPLLSPTLAIIVFFSSLLILSTFRLLGYSFQNENLIMVYSCFKFHNIYHLS